MDFAKFLAVAIGCGCLFVVVVLAALPASLFLAFILIMLASSGG